MSPDERKTYAMSLFRKGYNCSQSLVLAFADTLPLPEDMLASLSSSFGGGMARLREVCGAMTGSFMVLGLLYGFTVPDDDAVKTAHYERIQEIALGFEKEHGSILCRDFLGTEDKHDNFVPEKRTEDYYLSRPCMALIGDAAYRLQVYLDSHPRT